MNLLSYLNQTKNQSSNLKMTQCRIVDTDSKFKLDEHGYPLDVIECNESQTNSYPSFLFDPQSKFRGYTLPQSHLIVSNKNLQRVLKEINEIRSETQQKVVNRFPKSRISVRCKSFIKNGKEDGVLIVDVSSFSMLHELGVEIGDIIVSINEFSIRDIRDMAHFFAYPVLPDEVKSIRIIRDGKTILLN